MISKAKEGAPRRRSERGASHLKAVVWLAIMGVFAYMCLKVVPVLYAEYLFQDSMLTTARFATINRETSDDIRKTLIQNAQSNDIPVKPEDIHVTADNGNIKIDANYTVTVDLQVYQLTLNFHPSATNNAL